MLATHRTYKLLTYTQKKQKNTHKYAPVALYKNKNKVQKVHSVYSNVDQMKMNCMKGVYYCSVLVLSK